jgi:hypothetical protein
LFTFANEQDDDKMTKPTSTPHINSNPFAPEEEAEDAAHRKATRGRFDHLWRTSDVIGVLEVCFEPAFNLDAPLNPVLSDSKHEHKWHDVKDLWRHMKLRRSFVTAAKAIPPEKCFCGLFTDDDKTAQKLVAELNESWVKEVNKELEENGFFLDFFLWTCPTSKDEKEISNIMLIRFHELNGTM